jgi:hypothetical protein
MNTAHRPITPTGWPASLITVKPFFGCSLGMATTRVVSRIRAALAWIESAWRFLGGLARLSPVLLVVHRWWVRKAIMRAVALASVVVSLRRLSSALRKVLRPSMTSIRAVACSGTSVNT